MSDATQFKFSSSSVSQQYDEWLVPRMFLPWAEHLLDYVGLQPGETVVDVATGPGTVARLAAQRVGSQGRIIATDISPAMLEIARSKPSPSGAAPIDYVESGAAPLRVADGVADVVLCQQGLQFFPEKGFALSEMRRSLRCGGRIGIAVWTEIGACTMWSAYHHALADAGFTELAEMIRLPFTWPGREALEHALSQAGFTDAKAETRVLPMVFEGGTDQAFAALGGQPVGPAIAAMPEQERGRLRAALAQRHAAMLRNGQVHGQMSAWLATARAG